MVFPPKSEGSGRAVHFLQNPQELDTQVCRGRYETSLRKNAINETVKAKVRAFLFLQYPQES